MESSRASQFCIVANEFSSKDFEVVERKGLGHPDTLADMVAEEFSNQYSNFTLSKYNKILNHWVDKVVLSGGAAKLDYGHYEVTKPITAYLFGKVTEMVGRDTLPIEEIFRQSVAKVFSAVFGKRNLILENIKLIVDTNQGVGRDHAKDFYCPRSQEEIVNEISSNDSVFCCGHAPYTPTELLTIAIENHVNSKFFKETFFMTGYDVKVLITRTEDFSEISICVPFIASLTSSASSYKESLIQIKSNIKGFIEKSFPNLRYGLYINTKDRGDFGYLVVFGTALDKGDFGAVGRGNKYNGLISANGDSNIEAVAGKNPVNHSGKLYTILAHDLSIALFDHYKIGNKVVITGRNGDPVNEPSKIIVEFETDFNNYGQSEKIINSKLSKLTSLHKKIIKQDVVDSHIKRKVLL